VQVPLGLKDDIARRRHHRRVLARPDGDLLFAQHRDVIHRVKDDIPLRAQGDVRAVKHDGRLARRELDLPIHHFNRRGRRAGVDGDLAQRGLDEPLQPVEERLAEAREGGVGGH